MGTNSGMKPTRNNTPDVAQGVCPEQADRPDSARRRLVKGAAAAAPVILTLRSGAAVAQVSACFATPWQPGLEPSETCAAPGGFPKFEKLGRFSKFEVLGGAVDAQAAPANGKCGTNTDGFTVGYNVDADRKDDLCCQSGTVLVTASSATSLTGGTCF